MLSVAAQTSQSLSSLTDLFVCSMIWTASWAAWVLLVFMIDRESKPILHGLNHHVLSAGVLIEVVLGNSAEDIN